MTGDRLSYFLVGFAVGAGVFWQVSKVVERFRRARRDYQATVAGLRTLVEMMFSRGWQAVKWSALGAAVVAIVIFGWWNGQTP